MTQPEESLAPVAPPEGGLRGRLKTSLLIGLCCLLVYNANLRSISAGDTYSARYLPFAILQHRTVFLDPIANVAAQGRDKTAFWMVRVPGRHVMSLYPVVLPLLVSPLYVPAAAYLRMRGTSDARLDHFAKVMEKLAASFVASLSVSLLYLLLRRRARASIALLLAIAYAFGTTTWAISSQALWQHGMAGLLVIGALLLLTARCTVPRALLLGLLLGLIAGNRPPDVILAAALGAYGLYWAGRRHAWLLFVTSALPSIAVLAYNLYAAGNVLGGYGLIGKAQFFSHDLLVGVAGLLFSPTKGLFVYSPFLLFVVLAWRHLPRSREERGLTLAMVIGIAIQVLLYAKADWRGGMSYGPRYMTDFLPFLMWMLVPVVAALGSAGAIIFRIAVGVSIVIQAIGAFSYSGWIDLPIFTADRGYTHHDMRGAWRWQNAAFLNAPKHGFAPPDLLREARGSLDAVEVDGRAVDSIVAGQEAFATGWALTGNATPWQIAVMIDGQGAATGTFTDRPDVRGALGVQSPSGWRVPIDTRGLTPGEHKLTAMVWAFENGEGRYLLARTLTVLPSDAPAVPQVAARARTPADLTENFARAAARIREHQQADGYWLTAFTKDARFHDPHPEMNTFMTALLVDLLEPLSPDGGLDGNLQRARQHLTRQIEPDGLVRYHGLPNGPGIGTLGCAITPDTDNTALTWRIAPAADRARLTMALSTIDRYRRRDGLYRTWLAPRDAYQCLDPGSDPNPADIAIQMHLLMLLSEVKPQSAHSLCAALQPVVDDDRVWAYYRKAPLVPTLRLTDLRDAGCALQLPESRMRTDVADQQIWMSLVRLLQDASSDRALIRAILRELARDDFELVRTNPPLVYHNDLTATVPRYYWSEDVGYALWLQLYETYAAREAVSLH